MGARCRRTNRPTTPVGLNEIFAGRRCRYRNPAENRQIRWLLLSGHSTGGLVAALYAHRGAYRLA